MLVRDLLDIVGEHIGSGLDDVLGCNELRYDFAVFGVSLEHINFELVLPWFLCLL